MREIRTSGLMSGEGKLRVPEMAQAAAGSASDALPRRAFPDSTMPLRVGVSDIVLDDLEPWIKRGFDYPEIFHRHRAEIERLAAEKFTAGEIGRDGTMLVRTLAARGRGAVSLRHHDQPNSWRPLFPCRPTDRARVALVGNVGYRRERT